MEAKAVGKLRLGNIPDDRPVRIKITISGELQRRLEAYAEAWKGQTGRVVDVPKIIPAILDQFIKSDRAFARKSPVSPGLTPGARAGSPEHPLADQAPDARARRATESE
jgi:hypothetical protein